MPSTTFYNLKYAKQKELLHSAMELFAQYDYDDLNVRYISQWMGITTGAFYRYFGSKEEFYIFMADHTLEQFWVRRDKLSEEEGRKLEVEEVLERDSLQNDFWQHFYCSSLDIRMKYYFRTKGNPLFNRKLEVVREMDVNQAFTNEEKEIAAFAISVMQYVVTSFKQLEHRDFDDDAMFKKMEELLLKSIELGSKEKEEKDN